MGASFALALRKHGQVGRVMGYSPSPRTRDRAQQLGVIDAPMAGPGFRDFSRIAASDPDVWHDILSTNRQAVMQHTQRFRAALDALTSAMERNDSDLLRALIAHASQIRSGWTLQAGDNADGDESASWPCEPLDGGHPNLG